MGWLTRFWETWKTANPLVQFGIILILVFGVFSVSLQIFAVAPHWVFYAAMQTLMGGFVGIVLYVVFKAFRGE
jgi:hypothetical protein